MPKVLMILVILTSTILASPVRADDPLVERKQGGESEEQNPVDLDAIRRNWSVETNGPVILILKSPAVQEELELSAEELAKVQAIDRDRPQGMANVAALSRKARLGVNDQASVDEAIAAHKREMEARIREALKPEHYQRLLEITTQIMGPLAVFRPEIQRVLMVPPAQADLLDDLKTQYLTAVKPLEERRRSLLEAVGAIRDPKELGRVLDQISRIDQELKDIREKAIKTIAKVLTRGQKDRFNKLIGEPFDMEPLMPPDRLKSFRDLASGKPSEKTESVAP